MGTPGDKAKIKEVVRRVRQTDPEQTDEPPGVTVTTAESITGTSSSEQQGPSTTGMTIISSLTPFSSFVGYDISPTLPQSSEKIESLTASGSSVNLGQAHIEDYFSQSKFYSSSPEILQTLPSLLPQKIEKQTKTFQLLDEPGPSGLQTPKTKPLATVSRLNPKRTKKPQTSPSPKKVYVCQVCQKTFQNPTKLAKHQLSHTGSSPFKCDHCKKTFTSKFKLVRHVLIHSDRKPFSCSVCERTFHRKDHLKNHIKVHSPSKKHYACQKPDCKKEYTSLLSFKKHTALHAAEEGSLECQICLKTFPTKDEILYHLKVHAGSRTVKNPNEKKFTCDHCGRKFFTRKDVRRHLVVHTGMRDFLCQFCPQRFGRKDHLVRHIKKSHSKSFPMESQQAVETAIKSEARETSIKSEITEFSVKPELAVKSETPLKSEVSESSISTPEQFEEFPIVKKHFEEFPIGKIEEKLDIADIEVGSFPFFSQEFSELNPILPPQAAQELQFLPSTSAQTELKDLGSEILEEIGNGSAAEELSSQLMVGEVVEDPSVLPSQLLEESDFSESDIMRLLQTSGEEKNLPLPGFSQTFQSPPPQPPPPPE